MILRWDKKNAGYEKLYVVKILFVYLFIYIEITWKVSPFIIIIIIVIHVSHSCTVWSMFSHTLLFNCLWWIVLYFTYSICTMLPVNKFFSLIYVCVFFFLCFYIRIVLFIMVLSPSELTIQQPNQSKRTINLVLWLI